MSGNWGRGDPTLPPASRIIFMLSCTETVPLTPFVCCGLSSTGCECLCVCVCVCVCAVYVYVCVRVSVPNGTPGGRKFHIGMRNILGNKWSNSCPEIHARRVAMCTCASWDTVHTQYILGHNNHTRRAGCHGNWHGVINKEKGSMLLNLPHDFRPLWYITIRMSWQLAWNTKQGS